MLLVGEGATLYAYPITRDFGFAPNPFHGICTLATCKPRIRKGAKVGDWIMGLGGSELGSASKKCIYLMKITEKMTFDEYWEDHRFSLKKPVRNGSRKQILGDNIYHRGQKGKWVQEDSHHSNEDGTPNDVNVGRDTGSTDQVLISDYFLYFGVSAVGVDLDAIHYHNIRDYKKEVFSDFPSAKAVVENLLARYKHLMNLVQSDPVHFENAHQRVDQHSSKLT